MQRITYDIELLEPLLVTALDGDPNSSVSYNMIPGSVLRGALISQYGIKKLDAETRRLFFDGTTQFLNAYPLAYDEEFDEWHETYPLPLSLRKLKPEPQKVVDFAHDRWDQTGRLGAAFGRFEGQQLHLYKTERRITIHTQRHREYGRARREQGAVYQYDALEAGQLFRAHILCQPQDKPTLRKCFRETMHLGGSRSAGYGAVRLTAQPTSQAVDTWSHPYFQRSADRILVTLQSDLLLCDGFGNYAIDPQLLAAQLGLTLKDAYLATRPIGGFNRKWGLPLPQKMAFQMGSVFIFEPPTDEAQWDKLETAVRDGIGQQREDGFGRIAINWQAQPTWTIFESSGQLGSDPVALPEGTPSKGLAQLMVDRMLRQRLDDAIIHYAITHAKKQPSLSKSQIYRLRLKIQAGINKIVQAQQPTATESDLRSDVVKDNIKLYLADVKKRRSTSKQFRYARVDDQPLLEWITTRLQIDTAQKMRDDLPISNPKIGTVSAEWPPILILEYNLRLIDAVLAGIAKQAGGDK